MKSILVLLAGSLVLITCTSHAQDSSGRSFTTDNKARLEQIVTNEDAEVETRILAVLALLVNLDRGDSTRRCEAIEYENKRFQYECAEFTVQKAHEEDLARGARKEKQLAPIAGRR